jgi:hypothetical protein
MAEPHDEHAGIEDDLRERLARVREPGLDPQPLDHDSYFALEELKGEYWDDQLDGPYVRVWLKVALLNAGLRRAVELAPRELWLRARGLSPEERA